MWFCQLCAIFFKENRQEYYERLQAIRDNGDWEGWLGYFIEGVASVATEATETARQILALRERDRARIVDEVGRRAGTGIRLLGLLFRQPIVSVKLVAQILLLSTPVANNLVADLERMGLLRETMGNKR